MISDDPFFQLRLAQNARDLRAAQRLRYRVFVQELGGSGAMVDHDAQLEQDGFDALCDHLILVDTRRDAAACDDVVGVYRLLPGARLAPGQRFYSESEYDLSTLRAAGRPLLELGRSCLHPDVRGGTAMLHLWRGVADYVARHDIAVLFGVASFPGTDAAALALPLAYLHHFHPAPPALRVTALAAQRQPMDLCAPDQIDRRAALFALPPLIKAYLRLGGFVGNGAWLDHDFKTTDVCLVMDTARMSAKHMAQYRRPPLA